MANFNIPYKTERDGQIEFFDVFGVPFNDDDSILIDNTDGIFNGCILEFKLTINNLNRTLFQAIKYLSRMRIKGESVPATILLIDLNATTVYVYHSKDYLNAIQKVYTGSASKDNEGFVAGNYALKLDYCDMVQAAQVQTILKGKKKNPEEMYVPVDIDENCIVGWAERYYREVPNANKGDFLGDDTGTAVKVTGEIREPRHFKGLINPYKGKSNEKFKYLMDCLNDRLSKKDLGAFYTPIPYAKKAAELVMMAVERVPEGNDYIILDRCVDGDTEYFNGEEWKKISDYTFGEKVLTWYPDGHAAIEYPKRYINTPADEPFYHYVSNTLDMCLSASHRVVYEVTHPVKGNPLREKNCQEVFEKWCKDSNGFRGRIPLTFTLKEDVSIDENMLRVAVMINADGSYRDKLVTIDGSCKNPNNPNGFEHNIFEVRVCKPRKIERTRMLLQNANIEFTENEIKYGEKYKHRMPGKSFLFRFPFNPKTFPKDWIYLRRDLKEVFLEEIMYWDGSISTKNDMPRKNGTIGKLSSYRYSSSKKEDIDLVQMISHSCGRSTRIREDKRQKNINYQLSFRTNQVTKMTKEDKSPSVMKTGRFEKVNVDRKYCFETNSSYLILRRNGKIFITGNCAGSGNLEAALVGLYDKNGDELISHCVCSTYEYYEYKVLQERLGDKVRNIIPPTEANVVYENGKISNADAMSKDYIDNPLIRQYVDNPKCTIILFENPPFHDETASLSSGNGKRTGKNLSFVAEEMAKCVKGPATNELANRFIWSAYKYYLRQKTDSYILFSPIKYWKYYAFANKKPIMAFGFNRGYFHATPSVVFCILWGNEDLEVNRIVADGFEIESQSHIEKVTNIVVSKVSNPASRNYYKSKFDSSDLIKITCRKDGTENGDLKVRVKSYFNDSIIGYLEADSFSVAPLNRNLVRLCLYNGNGCYLTKDKYLNIIPIWVAKHYPMDNWFDRDVYATTSDGGDDYTKDKAFLKSCLIYTCLSNQNKCLSFDGSDGRRYQNELCFDNSQELFASNDSSGRPLMRSPQSAIDKLPQALKDFGKITKVLPLDDDEKELMEIWWKVLFEARMSTNYNPEFNYGVYQITKELNIFKTVGTGKSKKKEYIYPELNGNLETLRTKLKAYYKSHITEKMFKYELLK